MTQRPNRKVGVGAAAGAITVILVWTLNTFALSQTPIPPETASAITTVITFIVSYFVPERPQERIPA